MDKLYAKAFSDGIRGDWSYPDSTKILDDVDFEYAGKNVLGLPYTIWQISVHLCGWANLVMKLVQDGEMKWDYEDSNFYPKEPMPANEAEWEKIKADIRALPIEFDRIAANIDPAGVIKEWNNSTYADALMILISHTAYHTAQIVMMKRLLGIWKKSE